MKKGISCNKTKALCPFGVILLLGIGILTACFVAQKKTDELFED